MNTDCFFLISGLSQLMQHYCRVSLVLPFALQISVVSAEEATRRRILIYDGYQQQCR
ncbi:protein of unknown function [Methylotuvimicrobium alcaliphilum 20Z]|uniref:Uncharacterized protein n=1 Tax=Methylotuvimicrobium alcaliphilum (strain DSM 19304 / NCIMB 14124 / VKM B-2133 / 20Z) TaxID=1091494 RepID=G4SZY9_META2|nr:protein of unknown function [Methylotuvimicrobium alcaliphilum 20Z]